MDIVAAAHPFKSVFQVGCDKQAVAWLAQVLRQRPASVVVVFNNKDGMARVDIALLDDESWIPPTKFAKNILTSARKNGI